jgi:hypothetical protein
MSVPLIFSAVKVGGNLFVDGGAIFNYPLLAFGTEGIHNTLGLAFAGSSSVSAGDEEDTRFDFDQPGEYIRRMMTILERVQAPLLALYGDLREKTILIDTGNISSLQFKLSKDEQEFLIQNGRKAVQEYFQKERVS